MSDTDSVLIAALQRLAAQCAGRLVLGYSGGLDSTVLLHALVRAGLAQRVLAVHVHHGLSAEADAWQQHCQSQCQALGVAFAASAVTLKGQHNLEARARQARRQVLLDRLQPGDQLWLAQHQDDQAETVLLRLLRGAGSRGLGAMAPLSQWQGHTLCRPLLGCSRAALEQLAQHWQLDWVEDASNQGLTFDRNYLRHRVLPVLAQRWPAASARLAAAAERLGEDAGLLDELGERDLQQCDWDRRSLSVAALVRLSPPRQRNLLRSWISLAGLLPPDARVLQRVPDEVLTAAADREPKVEWPHGVFTRFRDRLYLLPPAALALPPACLEWRPGLQARVAFGPVTLHRDGAGPGCLRLPEQGPLLLRPARGGERLLWRGMHRQVSELWRQAAIPPWQRRQLPLLYRGEELVAVAAIGVADNWQPAAQTAAWQVSVELPGVDFGL